MQGLGKSFKKLVGVFTMKRLIVVVILLSYISNAVALDCETAECIGTMVELNTVAKEYKGDRIMNTDLGLWYDWCLGDVVLTPYTFINTWFVQKDTRLWRGMPFLDSYYLGLTAKYKWIGVNTDHFCAHSVFSNDEQWEKYNLYDANGYVDYHIGSNSSTVSGLINPTFAGFNLLISVGKIMETESYYTDNKLSYHYANGAFEFKIDSRYTYWFQDKRSLASIGTTISYHDVGIGVKYSHSNKQQEQRTSNRLYNENPLVTVTDTLLLTVSYQFN